MLCSYKLSNPLVTRVTSHYLHEFRVEVLSEAGIFLPLPEAASDRVPLVLHDTYRLELRVVGASKHLKEAVLFGRTNKFHDLNVSLDDPKRLLVQSLGVGWLLGIVCDDF